MLTENEIKASAGWRTNNINTLQTTKRIQYYNNENAKRTIGIFKKGKSLHGELLFLYLKGDQIGELEKKLPDDKSKGKPRLLFYSFYIPCACIAGCDFSCAEELKSEAKLYKDQYNFIVGFEAVFKFSTDVATNRNKAEMFLKGGGIELFEYLDSQMTLVQVVSQPSSPTTIFQVELSTLLTKNAVAEICLPPEQNKRNSIAIVFIKHVTSLCLSSNTNYKTGDDVKRHSAELTTWTRALLYKCFHDVVSNVIGGDCPFMTKKVIKVVRDLHSKKNNKPGSEILQSSGQELIAGNIKDALQLSSHFGRPIKKLPMEFKVYTGRLSAAVVTEPNIQIACSPPTLSPKSFCTKVEDVLHTLKTTERLNILPQPGGSRSHS